MGKARRPQINVIRQGGIYLLENCQPLDGGFPKARPVIVVDDAATLKNMESLVVVIPCSTKVMSSEKDRVEMPTRANQPQCRTGLTEFCWAVPRWFMAANRSDLNRYIGHVGGEKLKRIVAAYQVRLNNPS